MIRESQPRGAECPDRRRFLRAGLSCGGYLGLVGSLAPTALRRFLRPRRAGPSRASRAVEPWGRIEEVGEGMWAMVSTPLAGGPDSRRTLCNGGIVAGREGVLVVEAFATAEGARWIAGQARRLTGRPVTHVVITHHHGDHASGRGGFAGLSDPPRIMTSPVTRERLAEKEGTGGPAGRTAPSLPEPAVPAEGGATEVDLGGRIVRIVPRRGHTASDLTLRVEDPPVLWCGDLVWNGLFPNYMDARPSALHEHVRELLAEEYPLYVPGHGGLAGLRGLRTYYRLLEDVEAEARRAHSAGIPPKRAAGDYRPPASLGEWTRFSDRYYEVAFSAWARELEGDG